MRHPKEKHTRLFTGQFCVHGLLRLAQQAMHTKLTGEKSCQQPQGVLKVSVLSMQRVTPHCMLNTLTFKAP